MRSIDISADRARELYTDRLIDQQVDGTGSTYSPPSLIARLERDCERFTDYFADWLRDMPPNEFHEIWRCWSAGDQHGMGRFLDVKFTEYVSRCDGVES